MAILMISWSRGRHIGLIFWEFEKGPGPLITSGYADGHRVQMYVSITNTEIVMAILMISRSRGGHIGIMFWKLLGALVPLAHLAISMAIGSKCMSLSQIRKVLYGHVNDFMKWRQPYWILPLDEILHTLRKMLS